jgi:hypothetical protein
VKALPAFAKGPIMPANTGPYIGSFSTVVAAAEDGSGKIDIGLRFAAQKQVMPAGVACAQIKVFVVVTACTCP